MSNKLAKYFSVAYDSAEVTKSVALKSHFHSVRLIKNAGSVNPEKPSYITNILLNGNCIDPENRKIYTFYIDTLYGSAWIIEIDIDNRLQKVVYYDKYNFIGFNPLHKIYNARVVNGKIIWTDDNKPIYQIDINRAKASYYYGIGYNNFPTEEWSEIELYLSTQIVSHGRYFYKAIVDNTDVEPGTNDTKWERLCIIEDAYYSMNIENFYFAPIPPNEPPVVEYVADDTRKINNLKQTLFQIAYRYVYIDWRKSTFSPASIVPLPQAEEETSTGLANEMISINNSLRIHVNLGGEEVRAVEIVARSSDDPSTWYLLEVINKFEEQEIQPIISKIVNASTQRLSISVKPVTTRNLNAPPAPVATAGTNLTSTSFFANWNASAGATGYLLDVSIDPAFATFIAGYNKRSVGNVTTYDVKGLTSNAIYYYRVRAVNVHGLISYNSNIITVIIVLDAPIALEATDVFGTGMTANWQAVSGATGYRLDVSLSNVFASFVDVYDNLDLGNVLKRDIVGLTINTVYYYRVRAYNALGTSVSSNIIDQRTQAPPSDVVAIAANEIMLTSFMANWNASVGATGYLLDVSTNAGFTSFIAGYEERYVGNVLTYIARILTSNTTYYYRLKAINSHGIKSVTYSNIISVLTLLEAPVAIAATNTFETGMTANWQAVTGATGYYLDVSLVNTFASFVPGYNNLNVGNVTSLDVTGLTINTSYFYRVRAHIGVQTSISSNIISQRTQAAPLDPIALPATGVSLTSFIANWELPSGSPIVSGYLIDVATDISFANLVYSNRDVGPTSSFDARLLTSNTVYYYRIRAYNAHLIYSGYSNTVRARTLIGAPIALDASSVNATVMTANWQAVIGAIKYYLDVATDSLFANLLTGYSNKDVNSVTSTIITGLTINTVYYYRVRADNGEVISANSNIISQRTQAAPEVPVATAATAVLQTSFYANWLASVGVSGDYSGYYIDVATDAGFGNLIYDNRDVGNVLTFYARLLTANTAYFYRVRAHNAHGLISASSNVITLTTALPLGPPVPVATAATNLVFNAFTANWNASGGATGYKLDVSLQSSFASFVTGYNGKDVGNVLLYNLTGLQATQVYYYRVRAYNTDGTSAASNVISVTTSVAPNPIISINPLLWYFGGYGSSFKKAITVTTDGTLWEILWPSEQNYIHVYNLLPDNVIELYYEGPFSSGDSVVFRAYGQGGTYTDITFTGVWL